MQYVVASASVRSTCFARLVRSNPQVILRNGEFCRDTMRRERITTGEILSAVRSNGGTEAEDPSLVAPEGDGTISVISGDAASVSQVDRMD